MPQTLHDRRQDAMNRATQAAQDMNISHRDALKVEEEIRGLEGMRQELLASRYNTPESNKKAAAEAEAAIAQRAILRDQLIADNQEAAERHRQSAADLADLQTTSHHPQ